MISELLLLSKNDIPFKSAQLSIHQPTLKEIAYIGEEDFFAGVQFFNISKTSVDAEGVDLSSLTDFDVIVAVAADPRPESKKIKTQAQMLLALLFPDYHIMFSPKEIVLLKEGTEKPFTINKSNFQEFKTIVNDMFCVSTIFGDKAIQDYNPDGIVAKRLAEQFRRYHNKLNEIKNRDKEEGQKVSILSRYISILTVGEQKDMNSFLNYSVYQLFDEFERFTLKQQSDMYIQAKMAGAKDLKEVDSWMGDIHSNESNK